MSQSANRAATAPGIIGTALSVDDRTRVERTGHVVQPELGADVTVAASVPPSRAMPVASATRVSPLNAPDREAGLDETGRADRGQRRGGGGLEVRPVEVRGGGERQEHVPRRDTSPCVERLGQIDGRPECRAARTEQRRWLDVQ